MPIVFNETDEIDETGVVAIGTDTDDMGKPKDTVDIPDAGPI